MYLCVRVLILKHANFFRISIMYCLVRVDPDRVDAKYIPDKYLYLTPVAFDKSSSLMSVWVSLRSDRSKTKSYPRVHSRLKNLSDEFRTRILSWRRGKRYYFREILVVGKLFCTELWCQQSENDSIFFQEWWTIYRKPRLDWSRKKAWRYWPTKTTASRFKIAHRMLQRHDILYFFYVMFLKKLKIRSRGRVGPGQG